MGKVKNESVKPNVIVARDGLIPVITRAIPFKAVKINKGKIDFFSPPPQIDITRLPAIIPAPAIDITLPKFVAVENERIKGLIKTEFMPFITK